MCHTLNHIGIMVLYLARSTLGGYKNFEFLFLVKVQEGGLWNGGGLLHGTEKLYP